MPDAADELQSLEMVRQIFAEHVPFNRVLGLAIDELTLDRVQLHFDMRPELVGNFVRGALHGGVISGALDVAGGLIAFAGLMRQMKGRPLEERFERFSRLGTIDMRVDFLRPGVGRRFLASAVTLRTGRKVAVTRMELQNDDGHLIAVGTGAYVIS